MKKVQKDSETKTEKQPRKATNPGGQLRRKRPLSKRMVASTT